MGSESRSLTIRLGKKAASYERVHYIGHAIKNPLFDPASTREKLLTEAGKIQDQIFEKTGYIAPLVDIRVTDYPLERQVDFIIDTPSESPVTAQIIGIILAILGIIAWIVWQWWTVWVEKAKIYYCDQCPVKPDGTYPSFDGWLSYVAHLKESHPTKYAAIQENKSGNWWEAIVPAVAGIGIILLLALLLTAAPRRRERE